MRMRARAGACVRGDAWRRCASVCGCAPLHPPRVHGFAGAARASHAVRRPPQSVAAHGMRRPIGERIRAGFPTAAGRKAFAYLLCVVEAAAQPVRHELLPQRLLLLRASHRIAPRRAIPSSSAAPARARTHARTRAGWMVGWLWPCVHRTRRVAHSSAPPVVGRMPPVARCHGRLDYELSPAVAPPPPPPHVRPPSPTRTAVPCRRAHFACAGGRAEG
jgi:hypothetical protein